MPCVDVLGSDELTVWVSHSPETSLQNNLVLPEPYGPINSRWVLLWLLTLFDVTVDSKKYFPYTY